MGAVGRLARGKANYEAGRFLTNIETLEYVKTLGKQEVKKELVVMTSDNVNSEEVKPKLKEKKNGKSNK